MVGGLQATRKAHQWTGMLGPLLQRAFVV